MKRIGILIVVALIGVGGASLLNGSNPATTDRAFAQVQQEIEKDAALYDVRTPDEFAVGHFKNATLLPVQAIEAGTLPEEPKDKKLYIYCRSGNRSSQAKALLEDAGYTNVIDLGGLGDVQAMGGTLITKEG